MGLKAVETRKFNLDKRIKDIDKWAVASIDKKAIKLFIEKYKTIIRPTGGQLKSKAVSDGWTRVLH